MSSSDAAFPAPRPLAYRNGSLELSGVGLEGLVRGRDDIEVATDRTAIIVHVPATAGPGAASS